MTTLSMTRAGDCSVLSALLTSSTCVPTRFEGPAISLISLPWLLTGFVCNWTTAAVRWALFAVLPHLLPAQDGIWPNQTPVAASVCRTIMQRPAAFTTGVFIWWTRSLHRKPEGNAKKVCKLIGMAGWRIYFTEWLSCLFVHLCE